jgi:hypothetical protein
MGNMNLISCQRCGSNELMEVGDFFVCDFCQSKYEPQPDSRAPAETTISLNADVERLLEMCRLEPHNRHRYASLALDIDPFNTIARQYLQ